MLASSSERARGTNERTQVGLAQIQSLQSFVSTRAKHTKHINDIFSVEYLHPIYVSRLIETYMICQSLLMLGPPQLIPSAKSGMPRRVASPCIYMYPTGQCGMYPTAGVGLRILDAGAASAADVYLT